jgi:hypothetical protein
MLTPEQEADLKLFIRLINADDQPGDEFLRDSVDEIAAYDLQGTLLRQRDRAVALYYHRLHMMPVREEVRRMLQQQSCWYPAEAKSSNRRV